MHYLKKHIQVVHSDYEDTGSASSKFTMRTNVVPYLYMDGLYVIPQPKATFVRIFTLVALVFIIISSLCLFLAVARSRGHSSRVWVFFYFFFLTEFNLFKGGL